MAFWLGALAPGASASRVSLTWQPPTLNSDGTPLTNLAGYRVRYGTESGSYDRDQEVIGTNRVTISGLEADHRYFFVVLAFAPGPIEGDCSEEISWLVRSPAAPSVQAAQAGPEGCVITWSVEATVRYEILTSSDLRMWTNAPNGTTPHAQSVQTAQTNGLLTYMDTSPWGASSRFYRVTAASP